MIVEVEVRYLFRLEVKNGSEAKELVDNSLPNITNPQTHELVIPTLEVYGVRKE